MADGIGVGQAIAAVAAGSVSMLLIVGASFWAMEACHCHAGRLARGWRWLRVRALGGVTTLRRPLSYNCAMCQYSLDAHEEVRTLSCNHVFHCRESDRCRHGIDRWLVQESMVCPICRKTPFPVLPWKARPPPLSPAQARSAEPPPMPVSSSSSSGFGEPPLILPPPRVEGAAAVVTGVAGGSATTAVIAVDVHDQASIDTMANIPDMWISS